MTGLARYNLFCLPPAGLSESREATVGDAVVRLNYGRTGGCKERRRHLLTRGTRQVVLDWNEVAQTSEIRERSRESVTMIGPITDANVGVTGACHLSL